MSVKEELDRLHETLHAKLDGMPSEMFVVKDYSPMELTTHTQSGFEVIPVLVNGVNPPLSEVMRYVLEAVEDCTASFARSLSIEIDNIANKGGIFVRIRCNHFILWEEGKVCT